MSHDIVKDYYGKTLQSTEDLKTTACCDASDVPGWLKPLLANLHDDVVAKYYGCGLVTPNLMKGARVLDLGSGSGRDVYALAQLVGRTGSVVGVDMTDEQLKTATDTLDYHAEKFGYANVTFMKGYIEKLDELDLEPESFDVIVSNCVINLSEDKEAVLRGAYRLLKPGGEIYFSDVYADRRVSEDVRKDPVLFGECLGGALYWNDFQNLAKKVGFADPRLVEDRPLEVTDPELKAKTGNIRFFSATYRLFKLQTLEPACENYGQSVIYMGTIPECETEFKLDKNHVIPTRKMFPVCGNTLRMLRDTRFKSHFEFIGNFDNHYGIFDGCGATIPYDSGVGTSEVAPKKCC